MAAFRSPQSHSLPPMVMVGTAAHLIPHRGGLMHPAAVVEQPMDGARRKGVLREVGARRCLLQEDGPCRPTPRISASWRVDFSNFYSFFITLFSGGVNCERCVDAEDWDSAAPVPHQR